VLNQPKHDRIELPSQPSTQNHPPFPCSAIAQLRRSSGLDMAKL
jgi:hypothetical protein